MNNKDLFDQKIRDAINKYEVPFDDSAWKNIEQEINAKPAAKVFNWKPWIISAAAAAVLIIGFFAIESNESIPTEHADQNKIESKKEDIKPSTSNSIEQQDSSNDVAQENEKSDEESSKDTSIETIEDESAEKNEDATRMDESTLEEETLIVENENEDASSSKNVPIIDVEKLFITIDLKKDIICQNEPLSIALSQSNLPVEVNWDFGDGYTAEGPNAKHMYDEPGTYLIQVKAKSILNEDLLHTDSFSVRVDPKPEANFDFDKNDNMAAHPSISFNKLEGQHESFEWNFNDEVIKNESIVEKMFHKKGVYNVGLIVRNQFQCCDTLYRSVEVYNDYNLLAPTAFSPNGDGINDQFMPKALSSLNKSFTLQIFDPKTSQMIFESSDYTNPWNGDLMNNGVVMPEGAYAWSVIIEDGSVYKGTITITAN